MINLTGNYFAVEVPEDIINPTIIESHSYFPSPRLEHGTGGIDLPKGSYTFLFLSSALTEVEAATIVPMIGMGNYPGYGIMSGMITATESFQSLLTSKSLTSVYAILKKNDL